MLINKEINNNKLSHILILILLIIILTILIISTMTMETSAWFTASQSIDQNTFIVKVGDSIFSQPKHGKGHLDSYFYYELNTYEAGNKLEIPFARPNFWSLAKPERQLGIITLYDDIDIESKTGKIYIAINTNPEGEDFAGGYMNGLLRCNLSPSSAGSPGQWTDVNNFTSKKDNYNFEIDVNNNDFEQYFNYNESSDKYYTYIVLHNPDALLNE